MKNYDKSLDQRSYTTRFLVSDIKGIFTQLRNFWIQLLIYHLDASSVDVREGRVHQVSYNCTPEVSALSKGMQPQLYLTYTNLGKKKVFFQKNSSHINFWRSNCTFGCISFTILCCWGKKN